LLILVLVLTAISIASFLHSLNDPAAMPRSPDASQDAAAQQQSQEQPGASKAPAHTAAARGANADPASAAASGGSTATNSVDGVAAAAANAVAGAAAGAAAVRDHHSPGALNASADAGGTAESLEACLLALGVASVEDESDGMTALMLASSNGDVGCAEALIAAGARVDAKDGQEGFTALMMASAMGHVALVQRLLAAAADASLRNAGGATALMLATFAHKKEVVTALLEAGATEARAALSTQAHTRRRPPGAGSLPHLVSLEHPRPARPQGLQAALAFAEQADLGEISEHLRQAAAPADGRWWWAGTGVDGNFGFGLRNTDHWLLPLLMIAFFAGF